MDDRILDQLYSDDPQERKRAIALLAKSGDPDALPHLAEAFKSEDDPELKQLIIKAGKYIRKQAEQAAPAPAMPAADAYDEPEPVEAPSMARDEERVEYKVSNMQVQRAQQAFDVALDMSVKGDNAEAEKQLLKALKLNPNLQYERQFGTLAMEVLDLPYDDAVDELVDRAQGKRKPKASTSAGANGKRKVDEAAEDEVGWDTALIDLAIYFVVITGLVIVSGLILIQGLDSMFASVPTESVEEVELLNAIRSLIFSTGVLTSVIYGLFAGISSLLSLLIHYAFIHVAATMVLGGAGTFRNLIHRATTFITIMTVIACLASFGSVYISFNAIIQSIETGTSAADPLNAISNLNLLFCLGSLLFVIAYLVWFSSILAQAYDFGFASGCGTLIVSFILMGIVSCACTFALQAIAGSFFQSTFASMIMTSSTGL